jgi:ectoine hydroxylase-related dioxygenase (phytanoyl-CoA dioxygenase family)
MPLCDHGYVVIERALDDACVRSARELVAAVLADDRPLGCVRDNNVLVPLRWDDALVDCLLNAAAFVESVRTAAVATDLRWISGYVSVRPAKTGPLAWHQDWWCWDHPVSFADTAPQIAALCYLDTIESENAALRVVPGTHRGPSCDEAGARTLRLGAGDVVLIDYRVLHATTPNTTDRRRDCVLLSFTPRWRELPVDIRGHLVSHLALPGPGETVPAGLWHEGLLPTFDGPRRDLVLNRRSPWSGLDM